MVLYPRIIFLYLSIVFKIRRSSELEGVTLNPFIFSLTSTWLSLLSYVLSTITTDNNFIFESSIPLALISIASCHVRDRLNLTLQTICFIMSSPPDRLECFFLKFYLCGSLIHIIL